MAQTLHMLYITKTKISRKWNRFWTSNLADRVLQVTTPRKSIDMHQKGCLRVHTETEDDGKNHVFFLILFLHYLNLLFFFLFSVLISQQCNSVPHQHLELLFILFSLVSDAIVQKPSRFHHLSTIWVWRRGYYYAYTHSAMDICHTH